MYLIFNGDIMISIYVNGYDCDWYIIDDNIRFIQLANYFDDLQIVVDRQKHKTENGKLVYYSVIAEDFEIDLQKLTNEILFNIDLEDFEIGV